MDVDRTIRHNVLRVTEPEHNIGRFAPGMPAPDDDDVIAGHSCALTRRHHTVKMFHVEQLFPYAKSPKKRVEHVVSA